MKSVPKLLRSPLAASLGVALFVFLVVLALRITGILEPVELAAYDWCARLQPDSSQHDTPVVLLKVTENDMRQQGWPLTDEILARILERLVQLEARVIGLDIYRDIPVPPGHEQLERILTADHRIIASMNFGQDSESMILPPSVLMNTDRTGFNDILVDPGGIVRRALLFVDDGNTTFYSFALRLAVRYLQSEGINPTPGEFQPWHLRLGRTTIPPFEADDGGYVNADARGYQFLIDYKNVRKSFSSFTLSDLLSNEVSPDAIKDKIVVIGSSAEGVKDIFYTPHSLGLESSQHVSGVELHAQIVSQLLSYGLYGESPLTVVSEGTEWLWILLWCLAGGIAGYATRSPWWFSLLMVSGIALLGMIVYAAYIMGWWIPLVPSAMGYAGIASVITSYMSRLEKIGRIQLRDLAEREFVKEKRKIFIIDMVRENEKIKISGYEKVGTEQKTVSHYGEVKVAQDSLDKHSGDVMALLNRFNNRGDVCSDILTKLKSTGLLLYDELMSMEIKNKLFTTKAEDLIIIIDENLVNIPWELLYDGSSFFCCRFNMGRLVKTRQTVSSMSARQYNLPLKMLIVADPQGNLESAYREGIRLHDEMGLNEDTINIKLISSSVKSTYVMREMRDYDIFHYAGHADYDLSNPSKSGFILEDEKLEASHIISMIGPKPLPSLVFSNACKSGFTDRWQVGKDFETEIYGLANAFLLAGVQHYIGTFWDVQDEPSLYFAVEFYKELTVGGTVGEAVRKARLQSIARYGEEVVIWASYVLYGDPSISYVDFVRKGRSGSSEKI